MGANVNEKPKGQLTLRLLSLMLGALIYSPLAADTPKPSDTTTGGGMGGTGNTVTPNSPPGVIPLNDRKASICKQDDVVGEYRWELEDSSAQDSPKSLQPLCIDASFSLQAKARLALRLKTGQELIFQSKSNGTVGLERKAGKLGSQLEISVYAAKEPVHVGLGQDPFIIPEGYVGQIWIDGAQMFWGLNRSMN
jgi:hypothetical protein